MRRGSAEQVRAAAVGMPRGRLFSGLLCSDPSAHDRESRSFLMRTADGDGRGPRIPQTVAPLRHGVRRLRARAAQPVWRAQSRIRPQHCLCEGPVLPPLEGQELRHIPGRAGHSGPTARDPLRRRGRQEDDQDDVAVLPQARSCGARGGALCVIRRWRVRQRDARSGDAAVPVPAPEHARRLLRSRTTGGGARLCTAASSSHGSSAASSTAPSDAPARYNLGGIAPASRR